jgi:hypothetical protein
VSKEGNTKKKSKKERGGEKKESLWLKSAPIVQLKMQFKLLYFSTGSAGVVIMYSSK